ncbi:ABC-type transport auxiliary lipoprotein family protein [Massilia sp. DWR3-1-1]|uniref:ABC-type transport auxiliary lipoprotein family protein n=1 Tax=Massilia sp. DWR3-1-1 TaxID=2804559 RepID=UPI003CF2B752
MNPVFHRLAGAAALALILAGCAAGAKTSNIVTYDFGSPARPIVASAAAGAIPAIVVTDVTGNAAFDSERMYYRLNYADPLQARPYANSRWSTTPLQLLTQRFKSRVGQAGLKVLSATDASTGVPLLRIDVDDFTHTFDSTSASYGEVVLRASLFNGRILTDQRTFTRKVTALTADAGGGARALAEATDAVAADMIGWLGTAQQRKQ